MHIREFFMPEIGPGREIERVLLEKIQAHPNITIFDYHYAVDLITEHHLGQHVTRLRPDVSCYGAYVLDERDETVYTFLARVTLLATGGVRVRSISIRRILPLQREMGLPWPIAQKHG